jgi:hypothetical protein
MGLRSTVARATLAEANEGRDWRIYATFAQALIGQARKLYAGEPFGAELEGTAYALDTTNIELCLSLFPWAEFKRTKGAVRLHTQLDLRGNIPTFVHIDDGKSYDSDILDAIVPEAGAIYVMDRGFVDFGRLYRLVQAAAFFVVRSKTSIKWRRLESRPADKPAGIEADQIIRLAAPPRELPRSGHRQAPGVPHQQPDAAGADHRRSLQVPLTDRAVLQVDQAEPEHQVVLRHIGERGAHPDLDRGQRLRAGHDPEEAAEARRQPVPSPANAQRNPLRENAAGPATWKYADFRRKVRRF